jgi:hypothetical protein
MPEGCTIFATDSLETQRIQSALTVRSGPHEFPFAAEISSEKTAVLP